VDAEALAEPAHVRVHGARAGVAGDAPHLFEQLPAREDAPRVLEQDLDQLELEGAQLKLRSLDEDPVPDWIELEPLPAELAIAPGRRPRRAPLGGATGQRADAHHPLAHAERLYHAVVRA